MVGHHLDWGGWGRRWRGRWGRRSQLLLLWGHVVVAADGLRLLLWRLWGLLRALRILGRRLWGLLRRRMLGRQVLVLWLGRCLGVH